MLLTWHWTDTSCLWFLLGSFSLDQKAEGISLHRTVPKMLFQSVVLLQSCQSQKQKSKETLFKTSDPTACLASCFLQCSPAFIGIWEIVGVFLPFSNFSVKPRTDPKLSHCVPTPQLAFAWLLIFFSVTKHTKLGKKGWCRWMKVSVLEEGCLHLDLSRGALTESLLAQSPQQKSQEVAAKAWTASTPSLGRRTDNCPLLMMPGGYRALEKLLWKKPQLHPTAFHTYVELRRFVCFKEQDSLSPCLKSKLIR